MRDKERHRSSKHDHYMRNKDAYYERSSSRAIALRNFVRDIKEKNPCADCDEFYPYFVMEFDHARDTKIEQISQLMKRSSLSTLLKEIQKCDLVCANCHRYRTNKRKIESELFDI